MIKNILKEAAKRVAKVAETNMVLAEQRQDLLDALQQDLENLAEVADNITFRTVQVAAEQAAKHNPLANAKVDWSQFGDFVKKAENDFGVKRESHELSQDEMLEWMKLNVGNEWRMGWIQEYYGKAENFDSLKRFYNKAQEQTKEW